MHTCEAPAMPRPCPDSQAQWGTMAKRQLQASGLEVSPGAGSHAGSRQSGRQLWERELGQQGWWEGGSSVLPGPGGPRAEKVKGREGRGAGISTELEHKGSASGSLHGEGKHLEDWWLRNASIDVEGAGVRASLLADDFVGHSSWGQTHMSYPCHCHWILGRPVQVPSLRTTW